MATAIRSFAYDFGDARTSVSHPSAPIALAYDDRGLITSSTGGAGAATFAYDAAGRMTERVDAGATSTFTWTGRGELATAHDSLTGQTRSYGWDAAGQLDTVGYSGGAVRDYGYDSLGRLTADLLTNSTGTPAGSTGYEYDADGNLTAQDITAPGNSAEGRHTYANDGAGRITSWTPPTGGATGYEWDDAGNRTAAGGQAFSYDARNRLASGPDGTYSWTPRGTLASVTPGSGPAKTYSFDVFDRATGAGAVEYAYDGLDRLAARGGGVFTYAGTELDPAAVGAAWHARSPGGDLLATTEGTTSWITGRNAHGDLTQLLDGAGALAGSRVYTPFGEIAGTVGGTGLTVGYQSDYTDPASGDVWMGARWYQPGSGTFTARDTYIGLLQEPITLNRYTYGSGNPLRMFDPDGHFDVDAREVHRKEAVAKRRAEAAAAPAPGDCSSSVPGLVCKPRRHAIATFAPTRCQCRPHQRRPPLAHNNQPKGRRVPLHHRRNQPQNHQRKIECLPKCGTILLLRRMR